MNHIVLLGDSIFDNAPYVGHDPEVITQLQARLPEGWQATLNAVDGSVVTDVFHQLERLPQSATHLVLSVGGNNALGRAGILDTPVSSSTQVFEQLAAIREDFAQQHQKLLQRILALKLPTTLCTIYNPNFPEALYQRLTSTALAIFNDVILQHAIQAGLPLIDLRLTCNQSSDYANPIEPSSQGGEKIVKVILKVIEEHDFDHPRTQIYF